jgi:hypothetical protein
VSKNESAYRNAYNFNNNYDELLYRFKLKDEALSKDGIGTVAKKITPDA